LLCFVEKGLIEFAKTMVFRLFKVIAINVNTGYSLVKYQYMKYGEIIQNSFKNKKAYVLFPTLKDNL
jgi:hypothetical protein